MVQTFQTLENEKKELYSMARTDSLSGLANRNSLNEFLMRLIANASRDKSEFAFLFLDLDHFKDINDSLGHNVGDALLKKVSSIIDETLRSTDFVARVGGDEFVIIIQDYHSLMEVTNIVDRIQAHLSKTLVIQTYPVNINSSIGISFYPKDGDSIVSLMKNSDIAMYEAKAKGRGRYNFYTEELNEKVQSSIALDKNIRKALQNNEYKLYYQPKVDVNTKEIVGVEALIRWIDENNNIIPPDKFIPHAEETGFIIELGEWVVEEAIRQYSVWRDRGNDLRVSINISSK
jgi:diguanylate cyclase (GGDEF)-like protein